MSLETRTTDAKARVVLPKSFANATVVIEQIGECEVRVRLAQVVPVDEIRFVEEAGAPLSDRDRDLFLALLDNPPPQPPRSAQQWNANRVALTEWRIEPFRRDHERSAFSCGVPSLDDFIRLRVSQYDKNRLGKTYVAVAESSTIVSGYYTIAAASVTFGSLPSSLGRKLPRHPIPVMLIARLAVASTCQGQRLGETLLLHSLRRAAAVQRPRHSRRSGGCDRRPGGVLLPAVRLCAARGPAASFDPPDRDNRGRGFALLTGDRERNHPALRVMPASQTAVMRSGNEGIFESHHQYKIAPPLTRFLA